MNAIKFGLLMTATMGFGLAATPALAKGKPSPTPTPPPVTNPNLDEWNLIGLNTTVTAGTDTGTPGALANGGAGITVALLDGLTDCRDTDLAGRCTNVLISGGQYRFYDSHGTHTAGIIAGQKYGVATSATIRNYAVFADNGYVATGNLLIQAWQNAYDSANARIASMSFGCKNTALCFSGDEVRAMADATRPMLFVKAAGNDAAALPNESIAVSQADASAAMARTLLVGSVDVNGALSSFSNMPGTGCLMYSGASSCAADLLWQNHFLVAPGRDIYSTLPGNTYGYMSGTSMATPVVAAAAALLQARWPALKQDPQTLAQILLTTATDEGAAGVDAVYGHGLLNVANAFKAQGTVTLQGVNGTNTTLTGGTVTSGQRLSRLAAALGEVTVYDQFGRDFPLAETAALRFRHDFRASRQLLGRRLLGLGGQQDWVDAFFAAEPQPSGFAYMGSPAQLPGAWRSFDSTLRMGADMPFKGGSAQLRLSGATDARMDFAYDPTLRVLGFFASSAMMKNSLVANALIRLGGDSRLMVYGTTTAGAVDGYRETNPLALRVTDDGYMPQLALRGPRNQERSSGIGVGWWRRAGSTVFGINASVMSQTGGYYDLTSDLTAFARPTRMFNLGAAVSHGMGDWEIRGSGEITHLRMTGGADGLRFTPANLVSAEVELRKAGVGFAGPTMRDSLGVAFVLPPRAVSGNLRVDYLGPTADGLGRLPMRYEVPLARLGSEPPRVEAAYRLNGGDGWKLDLTGGVNLGDAAYTGAGEAMASFSVAF